MSVNLELQRLMSLKEEKCVMGLFFFYELLSASLFDVLFENTE